MTPTTKLADDKSVLGSWQAFGRRNVDIDTGPRGQDVQNIKQLYDNTSSQHDAQTPHKMQCQG
jgi:hypothetical protein